MVSHVTRCGLLLAALLVTSESNAADVLVPLNATWRYLADGSNQGTAWRASGFDDSAWAAGPAELGYGDNDEATIVGFGPDPAQKYITTWFRHTFNVSQAYQGLTLDLLRDDGAVVYLNGVLVVRSNMPATYDYLTLSSNSVAGLEEDTLYPYPVDASLLLIGSNVLAVEVHQTAANSSDISLDVRLRAEITPVLSREPYLQLATPDRITVRWRTSGATDSVVNFGPLPGSTAITVSDPALTEEHEVTLTGLTPLARYYYHVGSSTQVFAGGGVNHYFDVPPPVGTPKQTRAWLIGDSGTADANALAVKLAYLATGAGVPTDVWLMLGDNAYVTGDEAEYQRAVFDVYPELLRTTALWPTRGNHEANPSIYFGNFTLPTAGEAGGVASGTEAYYSFDHANVHFICLDSHGSDRSVGGPMWLWLQQDLTQTSQDWIVAFWHHPPYTKGSHDSDVEINLVQMRSNFLPLLEQGGVDLVFCGHSHSYERSFLLNGHYQDSSTLTSTMILDPGDGRETGDGPYVKAAMPHAGAVYTVAGSSGKTEAAALDHPVMVHSALTLGSVVLDFDGDRVDGRFITANGVVNDSFTLIKFQDAGLTGNTTVLSTSTGGQQGLTLDAGLAHAGQAYFLLGSVTGTAPGVPIGGGQTLPLIPDVYTSITIQFANTSVFANTRGTLDALGVAAAAINLPTGTPPSLVGITLYHAFLATTAAGGVSFVSNAFPLTMQP